MKLFNQFSILPRYLNAFNYAGEKMKATPKELEKCPPEIKNFWKKECMEYPTNGHFLNELCKKGLEMIEDQLKGKTEPRPSLMVLSRGSKTER